jgi:hypothetical protein
MHRALFWRHGTVPLSLFFLENYRFNSIKAEKFPNDKEA